MPAAFNMNHLIILVLLPIVICFSQKNSGQKALSNPSNASISRNDTTRHYILTGQIIETVTEKKIYGLCPHCAMAIRFKIDTTDEKWKVINVVVYESQLERAKFNSPAATFTIYAKDKRDGPQVAIYPASGKELNDNIPLLWCDSLKANF